MELDDLPKKKDTPVDALEAEKLDDYSVDELKERIKILKREIERTEKDLKSKDASKAAAEAVFK
ncbi:MAG: DUF1192 domain-containing protein [Alphaproteobacteria bacterium]